MFRKRHFIGFIIVWLVIAFTVDQTIASTKNPTADDGGENIRLYDLTGYWNDNDGNPIWIYEENRELFLTTESELGWTEAKGEWGVQEGYPFMGRITIVDPETQAETHLYFCVTDTLTKMILSDGRTWMRTEY